MNELKLSVVIPAYNEEKNVGAVLAELEEALGSNAIPYELIVVNDSSTDGTVDVVNAVSARNNRVRLVSRTTPRGFGRAIRAGLDAVAGDVVVIYMADQSDRPADVVRYYRCIEEGYDCVFGSRFIRGSKVEKYPPVKLVVNRIVNKLIQLLFWCPFNDLTNAFKAYRTHVIRECSPFQASHFNITIELSLSAVVRRYTIAEIPIEWHGRSWGSSNLRLREMGRRYLSTLIKLFCEKLLISDDLVAERLMKRASHDRRLSMLEARLAAVEDRLQTTSETPPPRSAESTATARGEGGVVS